MPSRHPAPSLAFLSLAAAVGLAACGPSGAPGGHGGAGGGMPPAAVSVLEVQPRTVPVEFEFPAQTAGSREVEVRARVPGIILKRNFEEGAPVKAGQSLFTLDSAPFEAAAARAEAEVAAAEARLTAASRNAKRMKPLFEAKAVSQKDNDDAASAEDVAAADLKSARARLNEARLSLQYTRVEAPVSGVTSRALKSEGSLVPGPDVLLTTVSQNDPIHVNFGFSEADQARFRDEAAAGRLKMPANNRFDVVVRTEDGKAYPHAGKLAFTDTRLNAATGTSDARAELPNPNGALRPGQFVRAVLKGAERINALTVPQRSVMEGPQGKMVYVLGAENKAEPRPITVGEWVGSDQVVTNGLKAGDKVIVEGLMKVFPGAVVQVAPPPQPSPKGEGDAKGEGAKPKPETKK